MIGGSQDRPVSPGTPATLVLLAAALALGVAVVLGVTGGQFAGGPSDAGLPKLAGLVILCAGAVPSLALLWLAAFGYGGLLRHVLTPGCQHGRVIEAGMGMAALLLLHWLVGVTLGVGLATTLAVTGLGVLALIVRLFVGLRHRKPDAAALARALPWTLALCGAPLGLMLVAACAPPGTMWRVEAYQYDTLTYHLQLPREWLALGRIAGLEHNVYSYLPSLVESGYTMIGSLHASMPDAVYACQLFHVTLGVYAAWALGTVVTSFVGARAGCVAAAVFLAVPWTLITASCGYNEMAVIAFGATALVLMADVWSQRLGGAAAVGFLVGVATLSKLTAGPMIAVPIGLMLLLRLNPALRWRQPPSWKVGLRSLTIATLAGLLTLSPYLMRNAVWTGNPVFPFATDVLGSAHWSQAQAERWAAAHGLHSQIGDDRLGPVARRWLFNTGYGAVGGKAIQLDITDIARFSHEGGFPVLWVGMLLMFLCAARRGSTRRITWVMALMLIAQLTFWLFATHMQSRFLLPLLLPTSIVIGLGLGRLCEQTPRLRFIWPIAAAALPVVLFTVSLAVLFGQVRPLPQEGTSHDPPPGFWVDTLWLFVGPEGAGHPINALPRGSRVCLIADNGGLLYLQREAGYATPFDTAPLALAQQPPTATHAPGSAPGTAPNTTPGAVTARLVASGYTHVWVGWSELDRLAKTHNQDPGTGIEAVRTLSEHWQRYD